MTVYELNTLLTTSDSNVKPFYLIDVRRLDEWNFNRLPFAHHHPLDNLSQTHHLIPSDHTIIVYCHHGVRSQRACELLKCLDFDKVENLDGGIHAWSMNIDPSVKTYL